MKKQQTNANRFGKSNNEPNANSIDTHFNYNSFDNNNTIVNINYVSMAKSRYIILQL